MEPIKKELYSIVLARKLKSPLSLRYHGKIIASGTRGMFLCRDSVGYLWFETEASFHTYFRLFTRSCGLFVTTHATVARPLAPFLVKSGGKPIIIGEHEDVIISYPSGICYLLRKKSDGKDTFFPIHINTSEKPAFTFCF